MAATDPTQLTLSQAAALIRERQLSPVELTEACISRAEALDSRLHAFLTPTFDIARADARKAADEIAAGNYRGPLHGIPFGLKDLFETAGVRTTAGSPIRDTYVPDEDAQVVRLLKDAGIVLMGKLNMHEWALGTTNVNAFYPSPCNPWDPDRITGGSSGGSGVAIAASFCLGTLGSDTGGSIRIPSSLCGISGIKPTYGRVSQRGVVPLNWSLDTIGPMARTAEDCALILQVIAGYDDEDPTTADVPLPDYSAYLDQGLAGLRIGVPRRYFYDPEIVLPEVAFAVGTAADTLRSLGAEVVDVELPDVVTLDDFGYFLPDAAAYHEERLAEMPERYGPSVMSRLAPALSVNGMDVSRAHYRQLQSQQALRRVFETVDMLLTPTTAVPAPPFPEEGVEIPASLLGRGTRPFNIAHVPAISVPCGFSPEGLPIGMMLVGRWWEEGTLLRAAHAYQQATDWHLRRPPL